MVSENIDPEETLHEIELEDDIDTPNVRGYVQVHVPSSEMEDDMNASNVKTRYSTQKCCGMGLVNFLKASTSRLRSIFRRTVDQREEISLSAPSSVGVRQRFHIDFIRKIDWASLADIFKEWIKHPMNIALLAWLICVAVSSSMLGLLLLGLLDTAFPTRESRYRWIEINNQVLNALFTLLSLYQHPNLFHHMVLLCRWRLEDVVELRKVYCKDRAYRPHEWAHMMLVVLLLHITCFSQYVLCGLYWGYSSKERPALVENLSFALGTIMPIAAGAYVVYSPLGREFESESGEELHDVGASGNVDGVASKPEWIGGLCDCRHDVTVGCLSTFCTFCVFGWNMERIGFGNMYVHAVTFFLLCVAPFWIFSISALNISHGVIRDVVGISGLVLCFLGLLYGGFWRIKMRVKFGLSGNSFCCGSDTITDYVQWMFCWACSLAQEVRTINFYDIEDGTFHRKNMNGGEDDDNEDKGMLLAKDLASDETIAPPSRTLMQPKCTG